MRKEDDVDDVIAMQRSSLFVHEFSLEEWMSRRDTMWMDG